MSNARNLARLLPNSSGQLPDAAMASGSVIQVVTSFDANRAYTTSTSPVLLSTSASITPMSANSKIIVALTTMVARDGAQANARFSLYRGTTSLLTGSGMTCHFGHWNDYSGFTQNNTEFTLTDSPNTTSPISYSIYGFTDNTSAYAIVGGRGNDSYMNCGTRWTLIEVAP